MKKHNIEIEIKTLLGSKENAEKLIKKLQSKDSKTKVKGSSKQLNHYFLNGDFEKLLRDLEAHLPTEHHQKLSHNIKTGKKHSVRTRKHNDDIILVVKSTIDETTSSNGTARIEAEVAFEKLSLEDLDNILLQANFPYQAKWSRERVEYLYKDYTVCIDKNAGYGYLAEFEKVVTDVATVDVAKEEIRKELAELGIEELPQDRLERMFAFYNSHWPEYYGTERTFHIE